MLTELEARIVTGIYSASWKLFTIPFTFKDFSFVMKEEQCRTYQVLAWTVHILVLYHHLLQMYVVLEKRDINVAISLGILALGSVGGLMLKLSIWIYRHEFVQSVNEIFLINDSWGKKFLNLKFGMNRKREMAFATLMGVLTCVLICVFLTAIVTRNEGYSYCNLPESLDNGTTQFGVFLAFVTIQTFVVLDMTINSFLNIVSAYICCATMNFWLRKIAIDWPKSDILEPEGYISYYKGIYILNRDFNLAFGKVFVPFGKSFVALGFVTSFFAVIRLSNEMNFLAVLMLASVAGGSFLMLIPMALIMSNLFDFSKQFVHTLCPAIHLLADKERKRALKRELKSCDLIRCQVGNLYHMEAKAKLTLMHNLINGTLFLLINAGK